MRFEWGSFWGKHSDPQYTSISWWSQKLGEPQQDPNSSQSATCPDQTKHSVKPSPEALDVGGESESQG